MLIKGRIVSLGCPGPVPELARSLADEPHVYSRVDVSCILYTSRDETWAGLQVSLQLHVDFGKRTTFMLARDTSLAILPA